MDCMTLAGSLVKDILIMHAFPAGLDTAYPARTLQCVMLFLCPSNVRERA